MRIATAQSPVTDDPRRNGHEIRRLMQRAHEAGARLIHFSEGAVSGYPIVENPDWNAQREELEAIAALAGTLKLWTVVGGAHHLTPPHRPHNSLYVISDSGELITRYDKRLCSHTEINHHYSPGSAPITFEVDGFTFGCALCIEVNFPELFVEYERLGVDCVLVSAYAKDPIFGVLAQAHAATNNYWLSLSVPAQYAPALPSGVIGPDGYWIAQCRAENADDFSLADLDRTDPRFDIALNKARPWRQAARDGGIYAQARISDARSDNKTSF